MAEKYETNMLAMIEAINRNAGGQIWPQYLRDEYRGLNGNPADFSKVLGWVMTRWPGAVELVTIATPGRLIEVMVKIHKTIDPKKI